jgi:hypothetical protein
MYFVAKFKEDEMDREYSKRGRDAYSLLVDKHDLNRPPERHRHVWRNNIKMEFKETGWEGVDWIPPA